MQIPVKNHCYKAAFTLADWDIVSSTTLVVRQRLVELPATANAHSSVHHRQIELIATLVRVSEVMHGPSTTNLQEKDKCNVTHSTQHKQSTQTALEQRTSHVTLTEVSYGSYKPSCIYI